MHAHLNGAVDLFIWSQGAAPPLQLFILLGTCHIADVFVNISVSLK